MANSVDPDQTAPIGAVCSWSSLFASILNLSVMLGNYLQQTTSSDDIFRFFSGALRVYSGWSRSGWTFLDLISGSHQQRMPRVKSASKAPSFLFTFPKISRSPK